MTQNAKLLNWLETHDGITTLEAMTHLRICRLSERCRELEAKGFKLTHTPEHTEHARVIRYRLAAPQARELPRNSSVDTPSLVSRPVVAASYKPWMR